VGVSHTHHPTHLPPIDIHPHFPPRSAGASFSRLEPDMTIAVAPVQERRLLGIGLVLIAYFVFTLIDSSAKWLAQSGMPTPQFMFARYAIHFFLITALLAPSQGRALARSRNIKLEIIRGLLLLSTTVCNFIAVQYLPLTITGSINFTMPLMMCALSVPLLGETVGWRRWTAILVGFLGVIVIVRPGTDGFHPAALLSLTGAFGSALYFISTRKLAGVDSPATQQFYAGLIATICLAPFIIGNWEWPTTFADWFAFILIGVAGLTGHQLFSIAARYAPASTLAPFAYLQIVYMTLSSWLIFNQPPDVGIYIGAPIVIGSGLYIWWRERAMARSVTTISEAE